MEAAGLDKVETKARIAKLMAEADRLNREPLLYPVVGAVTLTLACVALAKLLLT
jgi:hypothetical protein